MQNGTGSYKEHTMSLKGYWLYGVLDKEEPIFINDKFLKNN